MSNVYLVRILRNIGVAISCVGVALAALLSCPAVEAQSKAVCTVTGSGVMNPVYLGESGLSETFSASVTGDPTPNGEWELDPNQSHNPTYDWGQGPSASSTYTVSLNTGSVGNQNATASCTVTYYYLSTDPSTPGATTQVSLTGTGSTPYTVLPDVVAISVKNLVRNGKSVQGTVMLSQPSQTSSTFSAMLTATSTGTGQVTFNPSSVTVPSDGSLVHFTMTGADTSSVLNDISVTATGQASSQPVSVTVFDLVNPTCTATPPAPPTYYFANQGGETVLQPSTEGIDLSAGISVIPAGADPTNYQIGVVQNEEQRTDYVLYANPVVTWNNNTPANTVGYFYSSFSGTISVAPALDVEVGNPSIFYPNGPVAVPGPWNSNDGPRAAAMAQASLELTDTNDNVVGSVQYTLTVITVSTSFGDWCALFDTDDASVSYPGASTGWNCQLYSYSVPVGCQAASNPGGSPITTGQCANTLLSLAPFVTKFGSVSSVTYPATK